MHFAKDQRLPPLLLFVRSCEKDVGIEWWKDGAIIYTLHYAPLRVIVVGNDTSTCSPQPYRKTGPRLIPSVMVAIVGEVL